MAHAILFVAGTLWLVAALAGIGVASVGTGELMRLLPPLAIDSDAVGRTLGALAVASAIVGMAHLAIAAGVRHDRSWAWSAGALLAAGAMVAFLALAAAAVTSGLAGTMDGMAATGAAIGAGLASAVYAAAGASMVHRLRTMGPI